VKYIKSAFASVWALVDDNIPLFSARDIRAVTMVRSRHNSTYRSFLHLALMTRTKRSLHLLLVAAWTFFSINTAFAAEDVAISQVKGHPMTDVALSRDGVDPQLVGNLVVRKWLEAVEEDVDIRKAFSADELQTTLNRAVSEKCRHCVMIRNLRRVDSQSRMSYVRSGMPLLCKRNAPLDQSSGIDLDSAYRVFYQGLQAEARGVPQARLTEERTAAVERAFSVKTLQVVADLPGGAEKLADMTEGKLPAEEADCFGEAIVRATLVQMDEADREDLVLYILGGLAKPERTRQTAKLDPPFENGQEVFDTEFVLPAVPPALRKQLMSFGGRLPFKRLLTQSIVTVKAGGKTDYIELKSDCTVVRAPIVRCRQEGSSIDGTPFFGSFFLGDTFPWTRKQQDYRHGAKEMAPPDYSLLDAPEKRPTKIKPNTRMTFTISTWQGEAAGRAKQELVSCQTGGRYAASTIRPDLTGMAIDMNCRVTDRGTETSRYTLSYLEDLHINLIRTWVYPEATYISTYESVEVE